MDDTMKASMALCEYIRQGDCTPQGVESRWYQVFTCVLRDMGFTRQQRQFMWRELVSGNWSRLHKTDSEKSLPVDWWLVEFRHDVFYSMDRFSLDRLMRCHWMFRQYMKDATGECWRPK